MKRTKYSNKQKASIALEAIKGQKTINQISSHHQIHSNQIRRWQTIALEGLIGSFSKDNQKDKIIDEKDKLIEELYKLIGKREIEVNWLKKKFEVFDP